MRGVWIAGVASALLCGGARAWPLHLALGVCPYLTTGDGCLEAMTNGGNFKVAAAYGSDFYTWATKTVGGGQNWTSPHPQPFDVAGVDYAVGYNPALTLKDPATVAQPGCVYSPTGNQFGGPGFNCSGASFSGSLKGYDFSTHGCVVVKIANFTGAVDVENNRWVNGPGCNNSNGYMLFVGNSPASTTINHNLFDGGGEPGSTDCAGGPCGSGTPMRPIYLSVVTGNKDIEFNVFLWSSGRPITSNDWVSGYSEVIAHNYSEAMTGINPGDHGELIAETAVANAGVTIASMVQDYNTIILPNTMTDNIIGGVSTPYITAPFWVSTGSVGNKITYAEINNNTVVTNRTAAGNRTTGSAVSAVSYSEIDAFQSHGNYVDNGYLGSGASGSAQCYGLTSGPTGAGVTSPDFGSVGAGTADISLLTGNSISGFVNAKGYAIAPGQAGCN